MASVPEVRHMAEDDAAESIVIPNFTAPSSVDARASLVAWWGECSAILAEMSATAKRIASHARTEGDVLHYQILPDDLEDFAEEAEKLGHSIQGNPPMPARELRDPTAGLPPVDAVKAAARDAASATAKRVADMPAELRQRLIQREQEYDLHLRYDANTGTAEAAPSMEVATSDSLAVLFAAATEFVTRYYPTADLVMMNVGFPGRVQNINLPIWMPKGGAK